MNYFFNIYDLHGDNALIVQEYSLAQMNRFILSHRLQLIFFLKSII